MPSASPEPYTVTMFGWASRLAATCTSRAKRSRKLGSGAKWSDSTLSADLRPRLRSVAAYTTVKRPVCTTWSTR